MSTISHLEEIARLSIVNPYRTGEGMGRVQIPVGCVGQSVRTNLAIERIEGIEDGLIAGVKPYHRRNGRVPSVMSLARPASRVVASCPVGPQTLCGSRNSPLDSVALDSVADQ